MDDKDPKDELTPAEQRAAVIDALQKTNRIVVIEDAEFGGLGLLVFRKPTMMEYRKFKGSVEDEGTKAVANQDFLTKLVLYPGKSEFTALLDEMPGFVDSVCNAVCAAVGLRKIQAKKL